MKTKQKNLYLLIGAFLLLVALLSSCVDVPTTGPTPPPLKAEYRFIHGAPDMGDVSITVDGVAAGNLPFKGVLPHAEYTSGTKTVKFSNGESVLLSMSTDYRGTFVFLNKVEGERTFLKIQERRVFDDPANKDSLTVRVANCSPDVGPVDITLEGTAGTASWTGLAYKGIGAYKKMPVGAYTLTVKAAGGADALTTTTVNVGAVTERNTIFVLGSQAGGSLSTLGVKDN
ncbi:DUF4397 domain-containing protein [bacterium]|nr:DUF4397 domain-containing protein [bacterium]